MKKKHVEEKLQEERLDPNKRMDKMLSMGNFWQLCMEKTRCKTDELYLPLSEYTERTWNIKKTYDDFHSFLKDVLFVVALRHWIEGVISDSSIGEKGVSEIRKLLEHDLIPLSLPNGNPTTLHDIRRIGHQGIIEDIRCIQAWTQREKEKLVNYYVRFSCDLAKYTFDYVLPGFDPDRRFAETRQIPYEVFYSFIQFLSERDALLSQLLYFGAPSMEAALSLEANAIDEKKCSIRFEEKEMSFSKHLIQNLFQHAKKNVNSKGLVFSNLRGKVVERAHLNQSFARACERMPEGIKVTPGSLLR